MTAATLCMPNPDPGLDSTCPKCPCPLRYAVWKERAEIYECPTHGRWRLETDGLFYPYRSCLNSTNAAERRSPQIALIRPSLRGQRRHDRNML